MSFVKDLWDGLTGKTAADAAMQGADVQSAAIDRAIAAQELAFNRGKEYLNPLLGIGQSGIDNVDFLTDPQMQFDYLQNNPLFDLALENANTQTKQMAAARGRLSAGDTLQQLSNNVLLSASPLITQQSNNIRDLINMESGVRGSFANLAMGQGNNMSNLLNQQGDVLASGIVGAGNARTQAATNLLQMGLLAGGIFGGGGAAASGGSSFIPSAANYANFSNVPLTLSDVRLKENIQKIGEQKGFNIYTWTWNKEAEKLGLKGEAMGVLAQEVMKTRPDAVVDDGYLKVNYEKLGVAHG